VARARIARQRSEKDSGRIDDKEKETVDKTYLRGEEEKRKKISDLCASSFLRHVERADDLLADRWAVGGVH
jgi:hypothetical protein